MKKALIVFAIIATVVAALAVSVSSDQLATARVQSKIQFTKTITSSADPATGKDQFVLALAPNKGSLYAGSLTYTADMPIKPVILHELAKGESRGQPTWSVDNNTIYGISTLEAADAGSLQFTGAAVGFQSTGTFTVTVSVDGWIRGQPTEVIMQTIEVKEPTFTLPKSHAKATIPMHTGFFGKDSVHYVITDSSNQTLADLLSEKRGHTVQFAPKLRWAPVQSQDSMYAFTNGVKGDGIYGFQGEVFVSTPAQQEKYSPLRTLSLVSWKDGQNPSVLDSAEDVLKMQKAGRVTIKETEVTVNAPHIVWPGGQLLLKNATDVTNDTPFDMGQVISIDKNSNKVTFVAHRAWGFDGRTVYYIITDATPAGPAQVIGVPAVPKLANALGAQVFSDMYQFKNGIKGSGPLGFQQSVLSVATDELYVPLCRVSTAEWKDADRAQIIETVKEINDKKSGGELYVTLARPFSNDYVLNCPLVESIQ